jgi:hypothetical protein
VNEMAYYDGDFDQFLKDRLKQCKATRFSNSGERPQPKKGKNRSFRFNRKLIWLAVSYLVVIGLLFGSFGTAFAAKDSLPNEPLYAVKLAGEDLQLFLTSDSAARISLLTTFANRRVDEATILASQGKPVPEQVTTLIVEYQKEIDELATIMVDETDEDGVYRRLQPRDQDTGGGTGGNTGEPPLASDECNLENDQNGYECNLGQPIPDDQIASTVDLENSDQSNSDTATTGNSGTSNISQSRSGSSNDSGQVNRQEYNPGPDYGPGEDYGPGPNNGPSPVVPGPNYGVGPNYGPGNTDVVSQQPPTTNPMTGDGSANQSTENKGNKP